mgnify:FL=1
MIILGIDPGLIKTGFGLIKSQNNNCDVIDFGTINPKKDTSLSRRLKTIYSDISYIIDKYNPSIMAIEEVFYGKNVKSALLLGHARGAAMVCASMHDIPVFEYSARKVKKSVTGNGTAHKSQVQYMIIKELNLKQNNFSTDASDALAIALCHLNQLKIQEL